MWCVQIRSPRTGGENEGRGRRCANLESGKCVRGDVKRGHLDVCEEVVELLRVQCDLGQGFMSDALPQHDATIQGDLWRLVPADNHATRDGVCHHTVAENEGETSEKKKRRVSRRISAWLGGKNRCGRMPRYV